MHPRIVLVRHGRSSHPPRRGWFDAAEFRQWYDGYELAGIDPNDAPPALLLAEARRFGVVAASDAARAIASAERLTGGERPVAVSPLLRETELRVPRFVGWRMPLAGWGLVLGVEWLLGGAVQGGRPTREMLDRAEAAADWLVGLADAQGSVIAVTHGSFRRLLAARLTSLGWTPAGERRSLRTWSAWRFTAPAEQGGDHARSASAGRGPAPASP